MRRIPRKYVLIFLAFLTTLLCMVGSSTWIILSQKTSDPTKREKLDLTFSVESISEATPIFYDDTVSTANNTFELVNAVAKINNTETTVKGTFTVTELSINTADTGSSASFISQNSTATIQFTPTNTALYNIPDPITITSIPVRAMAYCGSTYFSTLNTAVTTANSTANETSTTQKVYVIPDLGRAINVTETLELAQRVNLYIPFENQTCDIDNDRISDLALNSMNYYADGDSSKVKTNRKTLINLSNGADIIINSGAELRLGGEFGTKSIAGKYCEINLDTGASIDCSGNLYTYGYIKENSSTAKHGNQSNYKNKYDNSYDADRLIKINSGGIIETGIAIYDMQAASTLLTLNNVNVFPLSVFDFPNLQTYIEIVAGAQLKTITHVLATSSQGNISVVEEICIVNSDINTASIFHLTSGNVGIEYCPSNTLYTTSTTGLTKIYLNGAVQQGHIELSISGETINTKNSFMPISYKFNIFINDNATFTNDNRMKFLPGSMLKVNPGGVLDIINPMIFYKETNYNLIVGSYPKKIDAILINNGTLQVAETGSVAALIQTEATDTSATLDFSKCKNSSFTVTALEGKDAVAVTRTSEGYFDDDSETGKSLYQFKGNTVVASSSKGTQCWDGDKLIIRSLNVNIVDKPYTHKIYSYQVFVADDEQGTNSSERTSGATTSAKVESIPEGQFVKIIATRHENAIFTSGDYKDQTLNVDKWYEVTSDMDLNITPNEGVKIALYTDSNSGNGTTTFTISESENGSDFVDIASKTGVGTETQTSNHLVAYVVKNWYFKVTQSGDGASLIKTGSCKYGTSIPPSNKFSLKTSTKAEDNYYIYVPRNGVCVTPDTLITLADGTQKEIQYVTYQDRLLVWDFYKGEYTVMPSSIIMNHGYDQYTVVTLIFEDGTIIKTINGHGFFDKDENEFVIINADNVAQYVGHSFVKQDITKTVKLVSYSISEEYTESWSILTVEHYNCILEGMLTLTPAEVDDSPKYLMPFELSEDMKYDEEQMQADIEKYGLYTYEDFKEYMTYEQFTALNLSIFKVSVAKGYITWEEILFLISIHIK